jgi:hypothetical protein
MDKQNNFASCFYGCETWSLTLMEENKLQVSENKLLRKIYKPIKDEVSRHFRILHNEELCALDKSLVLLG